MPQQNHPGRGPAGGDQEAAASEKVPERPVSSGDLGAGPRGPEGVCVRRSPGNQMNTEVPTGRGGFILLRPIFCFEMSIKK